MCRLSIEHRRRVDGDSDGRLTRDEFVRGARTARVPASDAQLARVFDLCLAVDGSAANGVLDYKELLAKFDLVDPRPIKVRASASSRALFLFLAWLSYSCD